MQLNPEDLRQQYDRLSDEALLEVAREDLIDLARDIYDAELAKRGLKLAAAVAPAAEEEQPNEGAELVLLAEFDDGNEAQMARSLLESAGIACWGKSDTAVKAAGITGLGTFALLVRRESLDEALELISTPLSEEELAAQAEAAGFPPEE